MAYRWCDVYESIRLRSSHRLGKMDQTGGQTDHRTKEKNLYFFVYFWLPEEISCRNVLTNLASCPKIFKSTSKTWTLFCPPKSFYSSWFSSLLFRSGFWDKPRFYFSFSLDWLFCTVLAGLGSEMSVCVLLFLPPTYPLFPSFLFPVTSYTSGCPASYIHFPSICPLSPHFTSPYWWKPQRTSTLLKSSHRKIDPRATTDQRSDKISSGKCICIESFSWGLKTRIFPGPLN